MNVTKIRLYWLVFLVFLYSLGITYQTHKAQEAVKQPSVPFSAVSGARVLPPLQNPVMACSSDPKCNLLAEAVVYEARGEPDVGKAAVAHVVLNRKNDPRWPNSLKEVVHQPRQFSYLKDKHKQTPPTNNDWIVARKIAHDAINGLSQDPTNGAVFYHTKKVKPRLSTKRVIKTASIGQHVFFNTAE